MEIAPPRYTPVSPIAPPKFDRNVSTYVKPFDLIVRESSSRGGSSITTVPTRLGELAATAPTFDDAIRAARELAAGSGTSLAVVSATNGAFELSPIWHLESRAIDAQPHVTLQDWSRKTIFGNTRTYHVEGAAKNYGAVQALVSASSFADLRTTGTAPLVAFDA